MFKSFVMLSCIVAAVTLLSGCTITPPEPMMFGMPQSQFQQLTPDQQSQVISGYNQQQQMQAQNAMIVDVANTAATAFGHH